MRRITTGINIRVIKSFAERSLQLEIVVNGEVVKCSRAYCYDRNLQEWFYVENREQTYVSNEQMFSYFDEFYRRVVKVMDMISENMAEIADS